MLQEITEMELIAIHSAPSECKDDIKTQCCEILNDEWPRSQTLRLRSLNSSRDDLPLCLALVQWFENVSNGKTIMINRQTVMSLIFLFKCFSTKIRLIKLIVIHFLFQITSESHVFWDMFGLQEYLQNQMQYGLSQL